MRPVYFSHGYREREAPFNAHFEKLMLKLGLLPSLDPPSDDVNAAKLERHLKYSDALIAVLSKRKEGPSPHILYEISIALRARMPILVFVEDSIHDKLVLPKILQCRFSARSYARESREHFFAIQSLLTYLGGKKLPEYRIHPKQRSCIITGASCVAKELRQSLERCLFDRGYRLLGIPKGDRNVPFSGDLHNDISNADLAISFVSSQAAWCNYTLGVIQSSLVPTILLAVKDYPLLSNIPKEYQRRIITNKDCEKDLTFIGSQIELFEEDFIEIDTEGKAARYADSLTDTIEVYGQYTKENRIQIIKELTMGDKFEASQVGAQGPNAHAHDMTFNQIWQQKKSDIDLDALATELTMLRTELARQAKKPEEFSEIGKISDAELEAKKGNGAKALEYLSKIGNWSLGVAEKIGVGVATFAIKSAMEK